MAFLCIAEDRLLQEYADIQREREPQSRTLETPLSQQIAQETDQPGTLPLGPLLPDGRKGDDTPDGPENHPLHFNAVQPTEIDSVCQGLKDTHIGQNKGEGATGGDDIIDRLCSAPKVRTENIYKLLSNARVVYVL